MGRDKDKETDLSDRINQLEEKAVSLENERKELLRDLDDIKNKAENQSEKAK